MNHKSLIQEILWTALVTGLAYYGLFHASTSAVLIGLAIVVLTAPSGLVVYGLGSYALMIKEESISDSLSAQNDQPILMMLYAAAILVGYLQWFVIIPKIRNQIPMKQSLKWRWIIIAFCLLAMIYGFTHIDPRSF